MSTFQSLLAFFIISIMYTLMYILVSFNGFLILFASMATTTLIEISINTAKRK
jgi:hypothetical protein